MSEKMNAMTEKYDEIEIFGLKMLFTDNRLDRNTIPDGWHAYDIREDDEGNFGTLEPNVLVNHAGTVLCDFEIVFTTSDFLPINNNQNFLEEVVDVTLSEYCTIKGGK